MVIRNYKRITILNIYRSGKKNIKSMGQSTIIKQQWLIIRKQQRLNEYPHQPSISVLIKEIRTKQLEGYEIIHTMDGN